MLFRYYESPFQRLRRFLRTYAWIEPVNFMVLFHYFVWYIAPQLKGFNIFLVSLTLMLLPLMSVFIHQSFRTSGEDPKSLGFRLDTFWKSGRAVAKFTLTASAVIIFCGLLQNWPLELNLRTIKSFLNYLPWAFGQQFVLQCFLYHRLRQAFFPELAMIFATLIFSLAHFPNPMLMITTALAGYCWCRLYERTPNIWTLTLSQAWLGTLLMSQVPKAISHGTSIGPRFWQ